MSLDSSPSSVANVDLENTEPTLPIIPTLSRTTAKGSVATLVSKTSIAEPVMTDLRVWYKKIDVPLAIMVALSVLLFACLVLQTGCATKPTATAGGDAGTDPMASEAELDSKSYNNLILKNTRHDQQYDGVYNKFEVYATFLNSSVQAALLKKKSQAFEWTPKQLQTEREKMFQENSTQTKFAVSFYVPSVRLNDLNKGSSIWKVYLEAGGQRYEGKASRRTTKLEDIIAMFPYHNRWSTAYELTFSVPLSGVEVAGQPVTFIITSMQGTIKLSY